MSATAPRDRLIYTTIDLIRKRGASGVAVSELLSQSGTARQSIYTHFPHGKNELIEEASRTAGAWITSLVEGLCSKPPAEALEAFVDYWKSMIESSDYTAGCPIAAATFAGREVPGAAAIAGAAFSEWERLLTTNLREHDVEENLARSLSTVVIAAIEGAVVMSIAARSTDPLDRVRQHLTELVETHTGHSR